MDGDLIFHVVAAVFDSGVVSVLIDGFQKTLDVLVLGDVELLQAFGLSAGSGCETGS